VWEAEYDGNTMYTCMKMEKWDLLKLFQEWGWDREWWRRWIQLWYIKRTWINVTMYPQYNKNMII
jgi:hypothetical protein